MSVHIIIRDMSDASTTQVLLSAYPLTLCNRMSNAVIDAN